VSGFETDPDHLRRSGGMLSRFGQTVGKAGERLEGTGQHLVEHASGDRSGVGSVVAKFSGRAMSILGKVFQQGGRVADKAGQNLHKTGDLHEGADREAKDLISRQHPDNKSKHLPGGNTRTASAVTSGGKESTPKKLPGGEEHKPEHVGEGGGKQPPKPPGRSATHGDLAEPPARKPSSAGKPVANPPHIPQAHDPGKAPDTTPSGPPIPRRGAVVERIDPKTHDVEYENGLIKSVNGKPVKDYIQDLSKQRAEAIAPHTSRASGPCSALAVDLRTGTVTEGVNGTPNQRLEAQDLHPVLQKNLRDMQAWEHPVIDKDGNQIGSFDGQAHHDKPLRHAEVKAVNELLWERERNGLPVTAQSLEELRFDPRFLKGTSENMYLGKEAGACANCDNILHGVPSYAGRFSFHPQDHRYELHSKAER
jgi:YwqJ-like deaminase